MLFLSKHLVGLHFASNAKFSVWFDLNYPGVYAGPADAGVFRFGPDSHQEHVDCSGDCLRARLRFDGEWHPVQIPWGAIRRVLTDQQFCAEQAAASSPTDETSSEQRARGLF